MFRYADRYGTDPDRESYEREGSKNRTKHICSIQEPGGVERRVYLLMMRRSSSPLPLIFSIAIVTIGFASVALSALGYFGEEGAAAAVLLAFTGLIAIIQTLRGYSAPSPRLIAALGVPLVVVGLISLVQTGDLVHAAFGNSFEVGSLGSLVLMALAIWIGNSADDRAVRFLSAGLALLGTALGVAALLAMAGSSALQSMIAAWPESTFFMALGALSAALLTDRTERLGLALSALATMVCAAGLFATFSWPVAAALIAAVIAALAKYIAAERPQRGHFLELAGAVALISIVMLAVGITGPILKLSEQELRPSAPASIYVIAPAYSNSIAHALIGTGPGSLEQSWERFRPLAWNDSPVWTRTPDRLYSTPFAFALLFGMLGLLTFIAIPVAGLIGYLRLRPQRLFADEHKTAESWGAILIFVTVFALLFPANVFELVLMCFAAGYLLREEGGARTRTLPRTAFFTIAAIAAICAAGVIIVSALQLTAIEKMVVARAHVSSNPASAAPAFNNVANVWPRVDAPQTAALIYAELAKVDAQSKNTGPFRDHMSAYASAAERAASLSPRSASAWLFAASADLDLTRAGMDKTEAAELAVDQASQLSSKRPDVLYLQAQLAILKGNTAGAKADLQKALDIKPNYPEAAALLLSLSR